MDAIEDTLEEVDGIPNDQHQVEEVGKHITEAGEKLGQDYRNDARDAQAFLMAMMLNSFALLMCIMLFSCLRTRLPQVYAAEGVCAEDAATPAHQEREPEASLLSRLDAFVRNWIASCYLSAQDDSDDEYAHRLPPALGTGFLSWIWPCWTMKYRDMRTYGIGLDITMLLCFTDLCMKILLQVGVPLIALSFVVHNFFEHETRGRDKLSYFGMGCTEKKSWLYNVHACAVWYVLFTVQREIYRAQSRFLAHRFRWLKAMTHPRSRTLLVEGIPAAYRSDRHLKEFFLTQVPELPVTEAYVIRNTGAVIKTLEELEQATTNLKRAKFAWKCLGGLAEHRPKLKLPLLEKEEVDAISHLQEQKDVLVQKLQTQRQEIEQAMKDEEEAKRIHTDEDWRRSMSYVGLDAEIGVAATAGFVTFRSRRAAMMAIGLQYDHDATLFTTSIPPAPDDVHYEHLQGNPRRRYMWKIVGYICLVLLFLFCLPISFFIAAFTNLEALESYPVIGDFINSLPAPAKAALQGVTASLGMTILMSMFPTILMGIFKLFFSLKGFASAQHDLQIWYYWFLVVFVVLITSVGSSLVSTAVTLIRHPMEIFHLLSANLPHATNFYLNYMTMQWVLHGMNLTRYINLGKFLFWRAVIEEREAKKQSEPEDQDYYGIGGRSARFTANMTIALVFAQLAPMITILTCVNFAISRVFYTYLTVWAESRKPDLGGDFWVTKLHNLHHALIIYLLTMIGVFMSNGPLTSVFIALPAPILWYVNYRAFTALVWKNLPITEIPGEGELSPKHGGRRAMRMPTGSLATALYRQPELFEDDIIEEFQDSARGRAEEK